MSKWKRGCLRKGKKERSVARRLAVTLWKQRAIRLTKKVHSEFFVAPSHAEFKQQTGWSLENAFTTSFKELALIR